MADVGAVAGATNKYKPVVKKGDTLWELVKKSGVARKWGVSVKEAVETVAKHNGIELKNGKANIKPGQKIKIPTNPIAEIVLQEIMSPIKKIVFNSKPLVTLEQIQAFMDGYSKNLQQKTH